MEEFTFDRCLQDSLHFRQVQRWGGKVQETMEEL